MGMVTLKALTVTGSMVVLPRRLILSELHHPGSLSFGQEKMQNNAELIHRCWSRIDSHAAALRQGMDRLAKDQWRIGRAGRHFDLRKSARCRMAKVAIEYPTTLTINLFRTGHVDAASSNSADLRVHCERWTQQKKKLRAPQARREMATGETTMDHHRTVHHSGFWRGRKCRELAEDTV